MIDKKLPIDKISMNKCIRYNLRCRLSDIVTIKPIENLINLVKIHILPFSDTIKGISGNLTEVFLIPYFKDSFRPIRKYLL